MVMANGGTGPPIDGDFTRRGLLKLTGAGILAAGAIGSLADCGDSASVVGGTAKRGGTLRVGLSGASSSENVDGQALLAPTDDARAFCLYNGLVELDLKSQPKLALAQEVTPNKDATEWTIRLKDGIEFHDGRKLTADDVIYSLKRVLNPKAPLPAAPLISLIDTNAIKKVDSLTVKVPFTGPDSGFFASLSQHNLVILPENFDVKRPVGTGPFRFKSFTAGEQSVFERNPGYWEEGLPYVDKVILTGYADETSQVNALLGGQEDGIDKLSVQSIATLKDAGHSVVIADAGSYNPFTMRVDVKPFDDPRVRQALRLAVDRGQMRELVFGGHGLLGNDVFAPFDPLYDNSLPQRKRDIEQAKSLLKQAGQENLTVELATANIAQGTIKAAQVLAQQVKAAGITIKLNELTTTAFYAKYGKWPFAQDFWPFVPYLDNVAFAFIKPGGLNTTSWTAQNNPKYAKLYSEALATLDEGRRKEIAAEMQQIDYNEGSYIIPNFAPTIDGYSAKVGGVLPANTGFSMSNYRFKNLWLN